MASLLFKLFKSKSEMFSFSKQLTTSYSFSPELTAKLTNLIFWYSKKYFIFSLQSIWGTSGGGCISSVVKLKETDARRALSRSSPLPLLLVATDYAVNFSASVESKSIPFSRSSSKMSLCKESKPLFCLFTVSGSLMLSKMVCLGESAVLNVTSRSNRCNSKNRSIQLGRFFIKLKAKLLVLTVSTISGTLNFSKSSRSMNSLSQALKTSLALLKRIQLSVSSCFPIFTMTIEIGMSLARKTSFTASQRSSMTPAMSSTRTQQFLISDTLSTVPNSIWARSQTNFIMLLQLTGRASLTVFIVPLQQLSSSSWFVTNGSTKSPLMLNRSHASQPSPLT